MPVQKRLTIAVIAMAVIVTAIAARDGSRSAGGADSYGYISQADRWVAGDVPLHQRFLEAQTDRPITRHVFSPLGWRPSKTSSDSVPFYAPGYPMILAVFKAAFGHAAMFWVVPLLSGAFVWSTFVLGCRLEQPGVGALAALLVASSATVLFMSMAPMSDVPSAALWTLALACVLGRTRWSAVAAGLVAALAILVRPNLLPLAVFMGLWLLVNDVRTHRIRLWQGRALPFVLLSAVGAVWIALLNARWYGSAGESGYGNLGGLFNVGHIAANIANYTDWLVRAETPLALAGLVIVLVAPKFISRRPDVVGAPVLLWAIVAWVWGMYFLYLVFEAWWYLRFLLPTFPIIALASAGLVVRVWKFGGVWRVAAGAAVVCTVGATMLFAYRHDTFTLGLTESRYPQIARSVTNLTDAQSAIITVQHSGSVRYYGGRMTARWDVITPHEFGILVRWLAANGHHPFLLIDTGELAAFREFFADDPAVALASRPALATYFNNETLLIDLTATEPVTTTTLGTYTHRAVEPAAAPHWDR